MTETEITINSMVHRAQTVYISHKEASYGIFCFNAVGDLFVNSDWGFYGYSWRSFGTDFKTFLAQTNADYIVTKFGINHREVSGKKMEVHRIKNLTILTEEFIKAVRSMPNPNQP